MTQQEWKLVLAEMLAAWPNGYWPDKTRDLGWKLMAELDGQQVLAAMEGLIAEGREFPPPPGVLLKRAVEIGRVDAGLLWADVWNEIMQERGQPRPWSQAEWSDAVRPFAEHMGIPALQRLNDPESSTPLEVLEAQWRNKWEAWTSRERHHDVAKDLPAVAAFEEKRAMRVVTSEAGEEARRAISDLASKKALGS